MNLASLTQFDVPGSYVDIRNLRWSPAEKSIARRAFGNELQTELHEVIQKAQRMAVKIEQPSDLRELESFRTIRRNEIDRKYDYRYSVLPGSS